LGISVFAGIIVPAVFAELAASLTSVAGQPIPGDERLNNQ